MLFNKINKKGDEVFAVPLPCDLSRQVPISHPRMRREEDSLPAPSSPNLTARGAAYHE
jgi:hypothetical protein